jgi:hypothetical protein
MSTLPSRPSAASQTDPSHDLQAAGRAGEDAPLSRYFFVGMALFMTTVVVLGFWPTYFGPLLVGAGFDGHWILHVHAVIFVGWMAVLLAQATLAAQSQMATHMRLGRYGIALGGLVLLMGLVLTLRVYQQGVAEGQWTWIGAVTTFWQPSVDLVAFAVLLGLGYAYRSQPEIHKRMMLFATVALLEAAVNARMAYLLGPWSKEIMFAILVGLIWAYDLWTERRVRLATLIGTAIVLPQVLFAYLPFFGS